MWKRLPKFVKNTYFLLGGSFVLWMLFFDAEDLITQYKLRKKLKILEEEKVYYLKKIEEVKKDKTALMSDDELLEKLAREKYFMKRKTEDLYIIVE